MKRTIVSLMLIYLMAFNIEAQNNNDKTTHVVSPGQTLFFISKMYGLSIDEIRKLNPQIQDDLIIRPDDVLNIAAPKAVKPSAEVGFETYTVQSKETLYSISKKFNVTVDELIQMNNLQSPSINVGQVLKVKKINLNKEAIFTPEKIEKKVETPKTEPVKTEVKTAPVQPEVKSVPTQPEAKPAAPVTQPVKTGNEVSKPKVEHPIEKTDSQLLKLLFDSYEAGGNTLKKEKGIANFLDQSSGNTYLALVNGVPEGEVIRVRNLMNNKVVYLKVLGSIPPKDAEKNIGLKISKAAAVELNVIEERFLAEWSWFEVKAEKKLKTEGMNFSDF